MSHPTHPEAWNLQQEVAPIDLALHCRNTQRLVSEKAIIPDDHHLDQVDDEMRFDDLNTSGSHGFAGSGTKRHLQYHPGIIRVYLTEILGRMSFVSRADRCQECHQRSMQGNSIQTEFTRTESKVISSITEQPIMHLGITQGTHQP
ncbi:AP endonuclease, family 2 [Aspergillus luchuensis]|uniref:AP endonuclease, family 2 n=1 Tax=Aspergillus kawachii TaxID=1069201 RepID=A0A146FNI8_ASPKA|nr:AP endonuclease, family 2 [Aspergillus luchuensis]